MITAKRDLINGILVTVFAGGLLFFVTDISNRTQQSFGPRFFPAVILPLLVLLGVILIITSVIRMVRTPSPAEKPQRIAAPGSAWKVTAVFALSILYVVGLVYLGYLVSTPLYLLGIYVTVRGNWGGRKIWLVILGYLAFTVAIWIIFTYGLTIFLPSGLS